MLLLLGKLYVQQQLNEKIMFLCFCLYAQAHLIEQVLFSRCSNDGTGKQKERRYLN